MGLGVGPAPVWAGSRHGCIYPGRTSRHTSSASPRTAKNNPSTTPSSRWRSITKAGYPRPCQGERVEDSRGGACPVRDFL